MNSSGIVIDESLQTNSHFATYKLSKKEVANYPEQTVEKTSTESYSTVIEQAILTQDKPLLQ